MAFDLQPIYNSKIDWSKESQMVEGGSNKFNNCIPTAFGIAAMAEGFPDIAPQAWVDAEYSPTWHGGTDFGHAIDFISKHYPNFPDIRVSNPRDTLAAIDAAGKAGYPMVIQAFCDVDAAFVDHPSPYFHMGIPVALDNAKGTVLVRNVYWGKLHELSFDFVKKMTLDPAGWVAVIARSIIPAAPPAQPADPKDAELAKLRQQIADLQGQVNAGNIVISSQKTAVDQAISKLSAAKAKAAEIGAL